MLSKEILLNVSRPGRYINHELNSQHRDPRKAELKFCLGYPDIYEVGMSNIGFRIIYDILNKEPGLLCERVFLPWIDLEKIMLEKNILLASLESDIVLKEFDCLGVSLHTELSYTGLINLLGLGGLPLLSEQRWGEFPLVIAGGPCCFNPEPLADFVDLFVIGEAEELILEMARILKKNRHSIKDKGRKRDLLLELSNLEGIYVPSFYEVEYLNDGRIKGIYPKYTSLPRQIKKRTVSDLEQTHFPHKALVPYIEIIHDRIGIEIMRGCPHACRFCQARNIYFPKRERSLENIENLSRDNFRATGYEEITLLSLSSLDHSQISEIFTSLTRSFQGQGVGISLSSLRANPVIKELIRQFEGIRRTGLTFAPEAGSERLRRIINKHINTDALYEIAEDIFRRGWRGLKLYFMLGLPTETMADLDAIVDMVFRIVQIKKNTKINSGKIRLSLNYFIPKPHTTFQWLPMDRDDILLEKEVYLRNRLKNKMVQHSFSNRQTAIVEALLSRGDRQLAPVLIKAWQGGARLEAWKEQFNFVIWEEAIRETGIEPDFYLYRPRTSDEIFPWDFIDIGIKKEELLQDYVSFQSQL